jgi:serine/alanine racemase
MCLKEATNHEENASIDVMKFILAIMVVGIHTEPFGFNIWLDRGFGIITRLCVPFFFIASSYYFYLGSKAVNKYLIRIIRLYFIWSVIYLPFDMKYLKNMHATDVLRRFLWDGNEHALWYLWGTVIATLTVCILKKVLNTRGTLVITILLLIIGCIGSTWSPLTQRIFGKVGEHIISSISFIGYRNGFIYGSVYVAVGMYIAENRNLASMRRCCIGFSVAIALLIVESLVFVVLLKTNYTILWLSVLPASYYLFNMILNIKIKMSYRVSVFMRKLSILIYVSHGIFVLILGNRLNYLNFFIVVTILSVFCGTVIICLSKKITLLKRLYQ